MATFAAADFSVDNLLVDSPVVPGLRVPVIKDLSVLVAEGTAFVQNAPGAGPEDYEVGVKNGLEIFALLDQMVVCLMVLILSFEGAVD